MHLLQVCLISTQLAAVLALPEPKSVDTKGTGLLQLRQAVNTTEIRPAKLRDSSMTPVVHTTEFDEPKAIHSRGEVIEERGLSNETNNNTPPEKVMPVRLRTPQRVRRGVDTDSDNKERLATREGSGKINGGQPGVSGTGCGSNGGGESSNGSGKENHHDLRGIDTEKTDTKIEKKEGDKGNGDATGNGGTGTGGDVPDKLHRIRNILLGF